MALVAIAGCGASHSPDDISGRWQATFAAGPASLNLSQQPDRSVAGSITVDDIVWSVTGPVRDGANVQLVILPSHDEEVLFRVIDLQPGAGKSGLVPAHAADRITLTGQVSSSGSRIDGTVSSALIAGTTPFVLKR